MYLSPNPEYTKKTKCNNNLILENNSTDFMRPIISNISQPLIYNHDSYTNDNNSILMHHLDIERSSISTRNEFIDYKKPVQQSFQNDYYMTSFDKLNNINNQEVNHYLTRNPVNSRRDNIEKKRNEEKKD